MEDNKPGINFIRNIIDEDNQTGKHEKRVVTRFPPEPNGYLHVGHAKSICLNFGIALDYPGAKCHLRFDDTNPEKEDDEFVESIKADVKWLGFNWGENLFHASDYFDQLFEFAVQLIKLGKAYVCDLNAEQMKDYRGTLTEAGKESPSRNRSITDNLDLFSRMKAGEFPDGKYVLRAKIDMQSGNINMRDPVIYRIRKTHHQRTGDKWCIYPMYDYTHCLSDSLENITHSICTLEFQDHRPLYDWCIETLGLKSHPQQIEFARLNLNYTVTSKRKLKELVEGNFVKGWDDPRLPTIAGLRRRGFSPAGIRNFCERIGVSKKETVIDMTILEDCIRDNLNEDALRAMCVANPLKLVIENWTEGPKEISAPNHPQKKDLGHRPITIGKEVYIEREDFIENPPSDFHRLSLNGKVRLRYGYVIHCHKVEKDPNGNILELRCTYDPETFAGKKPADGSKVKGIIHWIHKDFATKAEFRIYDRLFTEADPTAMDKDYREFINKNSLVLMQDALIEKPLANISGEVRYQFERLGYFTPDKDSTPSHPVFNRIVTLREGF